MRENYMLELKEKYGLPSVDCIFNPDVYWYTLSEGERSLLHHFWR